MNGSDRRTAGKHFSRLEYERGSRRASRVIAGASTLATLIVLAPGREAAKSSFFDREIFVRTFPVLLQAFVLDLAIFSWCAPLIAIWALVLAMLRDLQSPSLYPLRLFAILYTDIFRGVPVILVVYLVGFGIPGLGLSRPWNSPLSLGIGGPDHDLFCLCCGSLPVRHRTVHSGQRRAALSLGLSHLDVMRYVVLPQALRRVSPANTNMLIALRKDVALLSFIGPVEIFRQAGVFKSLLANLTPYVVAVVIFLAVTIPATRFTDSLISRQNRRRS